MGFNTVVFLLNDNMNRITESPKSVAYILSHPPMGERDKEGYYENELRHSLAKEHNEPSVGEQTVEVLPTFHADETRFYRAGGNCIAQLKFLKFGKTKEGKRTVTLELPEWDK